ncbi:MAG: Crp/Fnr family transcriptional regulator [Paracoccaceae bacterium]|jgi:CRP/FNR family transcriptional regulator, anaerobic regulatory protein|nr:Crp/Fnr family transcriptional regulator [Paracoccaceae bacterium]
MAPLWIDRFEGLRGLDDDIRALLLARGRLVAMPKGTVAFGPGKRAENLLLMLKGSVRVQQVSDAGREIVLFRIQAGESCVLTAACLLAGQAYAAEGIAETDIEAVAIPQEVFDDLVARAPAFRNFVFSAYSKRMTDLFFLIDEIAFQRMDIRLAQKLLDLSQGQDSLRITHQQLSVELGTAREVVSRQLLEFQRRGWVAQARGVVMILDRNHLIHLAAT